MYNYSQSAILWPIFVNALPQYHCRTILVLHLYLFSCNETLMPLSKCPLSIYPSSREFKQSDLALQGYQNSNTI